MSETRLYVASLSDYNNGHLHGVWIDIDGDTEREEIDEAIAEMLRESKFPNVTVTCPECEGTGLGGWVASCVSDERRPCPVCEGRKDVPSAEEWAVHDYDGIPATFGEHPDLDDILEFVEGVEEHGDAFRAWVEHLGVTDFIHEDFQDKFAGQADSEREWIDNHIEDLGLLKEVPANLRPYFDSESYLRDMKLGGDVSLVEFDGTVYAFWS